MKKLPIGIQNIKEILEEVIEDIALSKAIEEGRKSEFVSKEEIMSIIENGLKV